MTTLRIHCNRKKKNDYAWRSITPLQDLVTSPCIYENMSLCLCNAAGRYFQRIVDYRGKQSLKTKATHPWSGVLAKNGALALPKNSNLEQARITGWLTLFRLSMAPRVRRCSRRPLQICIPHVHVHVHAASLRIWNLLSASPAIYIHSRLDSLLGLICLCAGMGWSMRLQALVQPRAHTTTPSGQ